MKNILAFIFCICITSFNHLSAQTEEDVTTIYRIELSNGNEFIGTIETRSDEKIELKTDDLGVVSIPKSEIKALEPIDNSKIKDGKFFFDNPQASRYFFAPNGYGLRKGEGYYQNIGVFWNQASYGISDHFSIGGGMIPLFLFNGTPTPIWVTPKFSIPIVKDKFNLGVGAFAGTIVGIDSGVFGITYGTATFGGRDNNVTIGAGYGFSGANRADSPALTFSGMYRIGERAYLITENYALRGSRLEVRPDGSYTNTPTWEGIFSFGGRYIWDNLSLDYGLFLPNIDVDFFVALPWLSVSIPFGKQRKG